MKDKKVPYPTHQDMETNYLRRRSEYIVIMLVAACATISVLGCVAYAIAHALGLV